MIDIHKTENWVIVLEDDFSLYKPGVFSEECTAFREVHYPEKQIDQGNWEEYSTHHMWKKSNYNSNPPTWKIAEHNAGHVLKQTCNNLLNRTNWKHHIKKLLAPSRIPILLAYPMMVAGNSSWKDICFCCNVKIFAYEDYAGIVFGVMNGLDHYVFCLKKNKVYLLYRKHNELSVIDSKKFSYDIDKFYTMKVICHKGVIQCFIDDREIFNQAGRNVQGKIGVMANIPADFMAVRVLMEPAAHQDFLTLQEQLKQKRAALPKKIPQMKLMKKFTMPNICSGRMIRYGDLTGNGKIDILFAQGNVPTSNYNTIDCLTAVDIEGNIIFQTGTPGTDKHCYFTDLPFQIYDIDADGNNEIICARNFCLEILDGKTGAVKASVPTPSSMPSENKYPQTQGDAIYICNLSGRENDPAILLKNRYSKVWAYNNKLELLWEYESEREMGHFFYSADIDNTGRDHVLLGYSLLDANGNKRWELPLSDHADAVALFRRNGKDAYQILIAASDEGIIFADLDGRIQKQLRIGHMQTITVARLIPGSPDYQIATNTYWGHPGIIYIMDLDGNIIHSFQPSVMGSPIQPVNWLGNGYEFILLSAAPDETGGLYDGMGEQVVGFPDDGHPTLCYDAVDLDNDGIDELICWDHENVWIYECEKKPDPSSVVIPTRLPPLHNLSNYRANISITGGNE